MTAGVAFSPAAAAADDPAGTPFGNFESAVVHDDGTVELTGWVIDPNTVGPIYVWVTVDGVGRHSYANKPRPDVGQVYWPLGSNSGFDVTVTPPPGVRTICVTASNVGDGQHKQLACVRVEIPRLDPFGSFESAGAVGGGIAVSGWAIDPNVPDSIYVWLTIDGIGRHLLANRDRPDVEAAFPPYGSAHGFAGTVSAEPGRHTVCATASNVLYGEHTRLGCRSVTVPDLHAPIGNLDGASTWVLTDAGAVYWFGLSIRGWAIDPDTTGPIYVWVTVDGVGRHLLADKNRPDVASAFPGYGPHHGFAADLETPSGWHTVCVTASNVGAGRHTSLGCRTVNVL